VTSIANFTESRTFLYKLIFSFSLSTAVQIFEAAAFTELKYNKIKTIGFLSGINILAKTISNYLYFHYFWLKEFHDNYKKYGEGIDLLITAFFLGVI
jgi:hypothetical protein